MADERKHVDPGATMQVDALVEDYDDADDAAPYPAAPPPLPRKKASALAIVLGVVVVLLAAGLGIFGGVMFFGLFSEPAPVVPRVSAVPAPPRHVEAPEEAPAPPAPPANVVQLDEVVIDPGPTPEAPPAPAPGN